MDLSVAEPNRRWDDYESIVKDLTRAKINPDVNYFYGSKKEVWVDKTVKTKFANGELPTIGDLLDVGEIYKTADGNSFRLNVKKSVRQNGYDCSFTFRLDRFYVNSPQKINIEMGDYSDVADSDLISFSLSPNYSLLEFSFFLDADVVFGGAENDSKNTEDSNKGAEDTRDESLTNSDLANSDLVNSDYRILKIKYKSDTFFYKFPARL